ncbi:MAG TPA: hypothetical protein VF234_07180 [Limnochordia bacterium]
MEFRAPPSLRYVSFAIVAVLGASLLPAVLRGGEAGRGSAVLLLLVLFLANVLYLHRIQRARLRLGADRVVYVPILGRPRELVYSDLSRVRIDRDASGAARFVFEGRQPEHTFTVLGLRVDASALQAFLKQKQVRLELRGPAQRRR